MLRDSLTIFASFNVPPLLAPYIPSHMLPEFMQSIHKQNIAQFVAPAAIQFISTPMHLLGLDIYNRSGVTLSMAQKARPWVAMTTSSPWTSMSRTEVVGRLSWSVCQ